MERYIVSCSFLYGEEAKALNLNLLPNLKEFAIALSIIRHKLRLYQKSISDILSEGSEETGAHLVSLLERDGLKKDEIVELYKSENISQEVVETHFAELEEMKDREIDEFKKDYSAGGYLMLGIGILFIFFSIILQNGRIIIWAIIAIIIGIRVILKSGKIKK
ncbi:MAG: hypothetical protein IPL53_13905 [Ignavibacteria bacterium]|nr:hypothetical protein [Ignavibacteria bacterium]